MTREFGGSVRLVHDRLANVTDRFVEDYSGKQLNFCVKDAKTDWNDAFNFSLDLGFLANCISVFFNGSGSLSWLLVDAFYS
ncbi:hypothetical protein J5N97_023877 [Dioscorea zingiberensis]|uniref:Uncharacterized protein n=1 Tax=Dioscorea zingiberensis TaxID=325984 RepID=A0A9D5H8B2_9LILI|nr:hypothetical protein J5N97_023877 [Dioscorea zingiberensis]